MSLRAMTWALEDAPVDDPAQLLVLWALSDRANDDGTSAYPAVSWLADRARCSSRSVHRHLKALEVGEVIRRGDQSLVDHYRADRRPVVWDLNLTLRRGDKLAPRDGVTAVHGVTPEVERGDSPGSHGVTAVADKPSFSYYVTETVLEPSNARERASEPDAFDTFWSVYPRRTGKAAARKAWDKAHKTADAELIIGGAHVYAEDPNRDPAFTKHPATWLNAGCWDDEPLPARTRSGAAANQQHHDELFAAASRRAAAAEHTQTGLRAIGDGR